MSDVTEKTVYSVNCISPNEMTRHKIYDLVHKSGVCPATGAMASLANGVLSHDKNANMQHPYNNVEELVRDVLKHAIESKTKFLIEIEIEAGICVDDIIEEYRQMKNVYTVVCKDGSIYEPSDPQQHHIVVLKQV